MKLKHIESALSSLQREFPSPNVLLEQYPTSAPLTASVVLTAFEYGDLGPGISALDLGCGTGMLTAGCALMGCDHVLAVDCDHEALSVAKTNMQGLDYLEHGVDFILAKVIHRTAAAQMTPRGRSRPNGRGGSGRHHRGSMGNKGQGHKRTLIPPPMENNSNISFPTNGNVHEDGIPLRSKCVDTVLTNPPFGTKHNAGMDIQFLQTATRLARRAVYSFHKTSTRDFLIAKVRDEWGMEVSVVAQMKFDIPNTYKFHQKKSVDVEVDLLRILIPTRTKDEEATVDVGDLLESIAHERGDEGCCDDDEADDTGSDF